MFDIQKPVTITLGDIPDFQAMIVGIDLQFLDDKQVNFKIQPIGDNPKINEDFRHKMWVTNEEIKQG